ncbi:hypothetical protein MTO96_044991 [Rhipicephalus appendiculatus]
MQCIDRATPVSQSTSTSLALVAIAIKKSNILCDTHCNKKLIKVARWACQYNTSSHRTTKKSPMCSYNAWYKVTVGSTRNDHSKKIMTIMVCMSFWRPGSHDFMLNNQTNKKIS